MGSEMTRRKKPEHRAECETLDGLRYVYGAEISQEEAHELPRIGSEDWLVKYF